MGIESTERSRRLVTPEDITASFQSLQAWLMAKHSYAHPLTRVGLKAVAIVGSSVPVLKNLQPGLVGDVDLRIVIRGHIGDGQIFYHDVSTAGHALSLMQNSLPIDASPTIVDIESGRPVLWKEERPWWQGHFHMAYGELPQEIYNEPLIMTDELIKSLRRPSGLRWL